MTTSPFPSHVNRADLEAVARALVSQVTQAPSDSPEAFFQSATLWIERWVSRHGEAAVKAVAPFAIIFQPKLGESSAGSGSGPDWAPAHFFREELPLNVGGKIFLTSTSMFNVAVKATSASLLSELGNELSSAGLGEQAMLVVNPAEGFMSVCRAGMYGTRFQALLNMSPIVDLNGAVIDAELKQFHAEHTEFPNGFTHVFHDRKARILFSKAEDIIRDNLFLHFKYRAFRSKFIIREDHTSAGRTDLSIYDSQQGNRLACVIELKVLRSRGMAKSGSGTKDYDDKVMIRHARMGVRQAQKYKEIAQPPAQWAYICLFDGRDKGSDLSDVQQVARDRGVEYRRYFMEVSARDDLEI